jgi:hypothetical protein
MVMKRAFLSALLVAPLFLAAKAEAKGGIKVTFVSDKECYRVGAENGAQRPLKVGDELAEGEIVETKNARVELTLQDGSRVRLAPNTKVQLTEAQFNESKSRNVSVSMWFGRIWAKVAKSVGAEDTFEVGTQNAIAGVRGTAFTVVASQDLSAMVRVYAGTVGVRKGQGQDFARAHSKRQVPGPTRVDKKQWEEIIAGAMKQVKITSVGEIAPAEDFEDTGEDLKWAMWNQERDKVVR